MTPYPFLRLRGKIMGQGGTLKKSVFIAVFLLVATLAMADTLNLTGLPTHVYGGYYVGPAFGNLNGGTSFALICDDYVDRTHIPSSFSVYVSTIPELQHAMYADHPPTPIQVATYEQVAILMRQMSLVSQTSTDIGGFQFAIWNLFYPAAPDPGSSSTWVSWVQSQNLSAWDYRGVRIYTPTKTQTPHDQEFMSGMASQVPEPATLALIGIGLLGLGILRRRQLRR